MSSFIGRNAFVRGGIENLGATDEEITEFILSTLKEISFMACGIPMPPERREQIAGCITLFEGCAGLYGRKPIWRDAANSR